MTIHRSALRATFAGLALASAFAASTVSAMPSPKGPCVTACRQVRSADMLECKADYDCAESYAIARAHCRADTIPGPTRQACFKAAQVQRNKCRFDLGVCKSGCRSEYEACRNECSN